MQFRIYRERQRAVSRVLLLATLCASPGLLRAETYTFAGGLFAPPYVQPETGGGLFIELVREALRCMGHDIGQINYVSNLRALRQLQNRDVDMALHIPARQPGVFHSDPVIYYRNVAISLAENKFHITDVNDLKHYRVVGFQNARDLLGDRYRVAIQDNPDYSEQAKQRHQVIDLYRGGADVVVMDLGIFRYYRDHLEPSLDVSADRRIHPILPPTPRTVAFRDPQLRDVFNRGLREILANGKHAEIVAKYDYW